MNILLLSFSLQTFVAPDRWFGSDKVQHFFVGTFVQSASFGVLRATGLGKTPSLIGATVASGLAAAGKELRDRNGAGMPSVKDGAWTLAGAAAISPVLARTK